VTENDPAPRPDHRELAEDEIDLADLVAVLFRRRRLILVGTAAVFLLALVFSLLQPADYQVESYLEIGAVGNKPLQKAKSVAAEMKSRGRFVGERVFPEDGPGLDYQEGWSTEGRPGDIVRLQIDEVPRSPHYLEFARAVNDYVLEKHGKLLEEERLRLQEKLNRQRRSLKDLRERRAQLESRIEQMAQSDQAFSAIESQGVQLVRDLFWETRSRILNTEARVSDLESRLEGIEPTRVLTEPRFSEGPVSSDLRLHLALGMVLGLFLSVFAAFVVEFWANNRARILAEAGRAPDEH
jgi:uncharacterized protein involved in exopolysaccharide biosynthesis